MDTIELKALIQRELPTLLREDPALRDYVLDLTRRLYADKADTEDRFTRMLNELRRDREEQARKWDEHNRKWDEERAEQTRKWDEQDRKWEESNRRWEENNRRWEENNRRWDEERAEQTRKWDEQDRKWEENSRHFDRVHEEIMAQARKLDRSIGALGARWGTSSEQTFRNALAGILEEHFAVQVLNVNEFDDTGAVFGRPDQVELDVIIKNGLLILCELKSSMSKNDVYLFERKARFYEQRHKRKADRLLIISPMIDPKALKTARELGIETYSDSIEVTRLD